LRILRVLFFPFREQTHRYGMSDAKMYKWNTMSTKAISYITYDLWVS
jgi:hypothetical protein